MEDVAREAKVSRLIVYRNFESKEVLYREVLRQLLVDLGEAFSGLSFEDVAARGAATVLLPVARSHPAAFRLLWRDAWHQPPFADLAEEFRTYVTVYARAILSGFIDDEVRLDWAARSAGAHLVDGICNWLDGGDPARDDEVAAAMSAGLRAPRPTRRSDLSRSQPAAEAASTSTIRSSCSSVVTSGGQNVSVSAPIARVMTPPASMRSRTAIAS